MLPFFQLNKYNMNTFKEKLTNKRDKTEKS